MPRSLRNRPQSSPPPPRKASKTTARHVETSDDDDYGEVDLISDSDDDASDVMLAEEEAIIAAEEVASEGDDEEDDENNDDDDDDNDTLQPDNSSLAPWEGFENDDESTFAADELFFKDHMDGPFSSDHFNAATTWTAQGDLEEDDPTETRRVRFKNASNSDSSSSDDDDDDDDLFPDIFLDQNSLDPHFRRMIENDNNKNNDDPQSEDSYWDFVGDEGEGVELRDDAAREDSDSGTSLSDFYSDGDTTDEELPSGAKYVSARSVLRPAPADSSASESEEESVTPPRRKLGRFARRGPQLGIWLADASTTPFASVKNKKLVGCFPTRMTQRRYSFSGTPLPRFHNMGENKASPALTDMSPMMSNSANLMMSAMYTPDEANHNGPSFGPPEAFYPRTRVVEAHPSQVSGSSSYDDDDGTPDDEDVMWNLADLIHMPNESSDEDDEGAADDRSYTVSPDKASMTPLRPTALSSEDQAHPLLEHFDRGVVGAFRQHQNHHQLLSRNAASREALAFSGPFIHGTLRGIKGGRLEAANVPITPLRRSKALNSDMPSSPTPVDTPSERKRKFTGEQHGHKRSKSMV